MKFKTLAALVGTSFLATSPVHAAETSTAALIQIAVESHDHDHGDMAAKGKGVVNAVDTVGHKVNLSHEAIPSLGWPAMKMDFAVAPSVDLGQVQAGAQVEFTVGKNKAGLPEIQSLQPAKK